MTTQNGVTRPKPGTATGRVWEIADELSRTSGKPASRKDVVAKGIGEGINPATLNTQYSRWRRFNGLGKTAKETSGRSQMDVSHTQSTEHRLVKRLPNQVVGNVGLFYVCYRLSLNGWNAMPTSRNARGIDIIAYDQTGERFATVQVKSLSKRTPVPLGKTRPTFIADHIVICRRTGTERPDCYVLTPDEVRQGAHEGVKLGVKSYWLQPDEYEPYLERWDRIGFGHGE